MKTLALFGMLIFLQRNSLVAKSIVFKHGLITVSSRYCSHSEQTFWWLFRRSSAFCISCQSSNKVLANQCAIFAIRNMCSLKNPWIKCRGKFRFQSFCVLEAMSKVQKKLRTKSHWHFVLWNVWILRFCRRNSFDFFDAQSLLDFCCSVPKLFNLIYCFATTYLVQESSVIRFEKSFKTTFAVLFKVLSQILLFQRHWNKNGWST